MTAWTTEYPPYQGWTPQLTGDTVRITEDGRVRIIEQLAVRIVFRFTLAWTPEIPTFSPWTKE
jgi:hypothetical protein